LGVILVFIRSGGEIEKKEKKKKKKKKAMT